MEFPPEMSLLPFSHQKKRQEVKAFSQRCRSMEVEVAEVTALQFTLREMEMNADVVQQRLEQSQCFGWRFWDLWVLGG